jgi:hypothetical protein
MLWRTGGLALVAAGCVGTIRSIAPTNLAPMPPDSAAAWASPFQPTVPLLFELRWRFENREGTAAGRATARYAPPDTLRFDYRGPFGRSGSALVVGDEAVWSAPEGDVDNLVPVAPVLWAALGIVRQPVEGSRVLGSETPERHAWRYATEDREVDYIRVMGARPRLLAELREGGRILGVVETALDSAGTARPVTSEMRFPAQRSKFSLTVRQVDSVAAYPPGTWDRP